jgi:hypothetical protein
MRVESPWLAISISRGRCVLSYIAVVRAVRSAKIPALPIEPHALVAALCLRLAVPISRGRRDRVASSILLYPYASSAHSGTSSSLRSGRSTSLVHPLVSSLRPPLLPPPPARSCSFHRPAQHLHRMDIPPLYSPCVHCICLRGHCCTSY